MTTLTPSVALVIPVFNAEQDIPMLFAGIMQQSLQPDTILIIDSSSTDKTRELLAQYPVVIHTIPQHEFDHGGTRRLATELVNADVYIFMTQDAYPANSNTFKKLVENLYLSEKIGVAYGRQLPKSEANPLSIHGRLFNYPEQSSIKYLVDRNKLGIKTCFNSDNLAAYKKSALQSIGGFPKKLLTGEDAYVGAKLILQGYGIAYNANACIYHSHNLSLKQEFHRYFSIGVFHAQQPWIIEEFRAADSEGLRFVVSEMRYLFNNKKYFWIPRAIISTFIKFASYKLGFYEPLIPSVIKKSLGINPAFWTKKEVN